MVHGINQMKDKKKKLWIPRSQASSPSLHYNIIPPYFVITYIEYTKEYTKNVTI
jgi:hypothetical protein